MRCVAVRREAGKMFRKIGVELVSQSVKVLRVGGSDLTV